MFIAFYLFHWEKLNCWNGSSSDQLICQNKEGAEIQWSLFWRDGFHVYFILFEGKHIYLILISHLKHLFKEALVHVYSHLIEDWCIVIKTKRKTRALKGIFGNKGTIKNICYMSSPQRDLFTFIVKSINWGNKSWRCCIDNIFGATLLYQKLHVHAYTAWKFTLTVLSMNVAQKLKENVFTCQRNMNMYLLLVV